jgi:hypothetical protein
MTWRRPANGNASVSSKATRPNARVLPGPVLEICSLVVVATRPYGCGKVRGFLHHGGHELLTLVLVQPDADFECMGVLMEHTQDVKCVAWHPTEEVNHFPAITANVLTPVFVA